MISLTAAPFNPSSDYKRKELLAQDKRMALVINIKFLLVK